MPTTTETASSNSIFELNANSNAKWIRKSTFAAYVCMYVCLNDFV